MNLKIQWLRSKMQCLDLQGMIVTNPINIRYLIGIDAEGIILITRRDNLFITDARYIEYVNSILTIDDEVRVLNVSDLSYEDYDTFFTFCEKVGFEENHLSYGKYKEYLHKYKINSFEETEGLIEKQRLIKDDEEIKNIKKACKITDDCFEYLTRFIKVGQTEKEIAYAIKKFFKESDAEDVSFEPIVASGRNSTMPHAKPTDKKIESGDPIIIDMGCKYNGYCSDMTRTVFAEYVPKYIEPVYEIVLKNQEKVFESLKDGLNIKTIAKNLEYEFKLNGFEMIHSLGHGIGLEIHELPTISTKNDFILKSNMVITNEPGIYISNRFGIRIEDTVLIKKEQSENLTKSDKNCVVVDKKL